MLEYFEKTPVILSRVVGEDDYGDKTRETINNFNIIISKRIQESSDTFLIEAYVEKPSEFKNEDEIIFEGRTYRINKISTYSFGNIRVLKGEFKNG